MVTAAMVLPFRLRQVARRQAVVAAVTVQLKKLAMASWERHQAVKAVQAMAQAAAGELHSKTTLAPQARARPVSA